MTIQLDPSRVRLAAGTANQRKQARSSADEPIVVPSRADLNHVPDEESLFTLVRSAIAALKKGITWDRGTILNILT